MSRPKDVGRPGVVSGIFYIISYLFCFVKISVKMPCPVRFFFLQEAVFDGAFFACRRGSESRFAPSLFSTGKCPATAAEAAFLWWNSGFDGGYCPENAKLGWRTKKIYRHLLYSVTAVSAEGFTKKIPGRVRCALRRGSV